MKSLIFKSEMVKAILDGRKTQTRRVIKDPPKVKHPDEWAWIAGCPYGQVGDRLWVRETWKPDPYFKGGGIPRLGIEWGEGIQWKEGNPNQTGPWKYPLFMPRWASRITLEITKVRVQRIQEITEEDAMAEGIKCSERTGRYTPGNCDSAVWAFQELWDSLNAKRGYGWDENPFCWVLDFRRVDV